MWRQRGRTGIAAAIYLIGFEKMMATNIQEYLAIGNMFDVTFPPEWVKAALVLAFFSTGVVVGVFVYLNRFAKKPYLRVTAQP